MSAIEINNIEFSYNVGETILRIDQLKVQEGEKLFIFGPSGSGKSTLLNLLTGVITPAKGSINVLGQELSNLSHGKRDRFRGHHMGFIFQNFNLIPYLTIDENIQLPLKTSKERRERLNATPDEEIQRLTEHLRLGQHRHKKITELSVGQQQRVAVARAMIGNPEIVVADEPTSSLDEDVTDSFMKLIMEEHEQRNFTLIFVSHDRRLSKFFDRELALSEINGVNS